MENPEENRWVGCSRDGKCKYEFGLHRKASQQSRVGNRCEEDRWWIPPRACSGGRGDAKAVRMRITGDRPHAESHGKSATPRGRTKLITFRLGSPSFGRRPASADLRPDAPSKTPLSAGKKIMIQAAGDEKTIYATIEGTDIREGLIISVP